MESVVSLIVFGLFFVILGICNIKGNISSVHWYNRSRVAKDDIPKYGKWVGGGMAVIGVSLLLSAFLQLLFKTALFAILIPIGCLVGIPMILYAQFKYNGGLF